MYFKLRIPHGHSFERCKRCAFRLTCILIVAISMAFVYLYLPTLYVCRGHPCIEPPYRPTFTSIDNTRDVGLQLRNTSEKSVLTPDSATYVLPAKEKVNYLGNSKDTLLVKADTYLRYNRLDLIFKLVYAYFYAVNKYVPDTIRNAYDDHERVLCSYHKNCKDVDNRRYDMHKACCNKTTVPNFVTSFNDEIDIIRNGSFDLSRANILLDNTGFLLNGAHILAAAIVLSKSVSFQHVQRRRHINWNYEFFKDIGLPVEISDLILLEWMKIQFEKNDLNTTISIVCISSQDKRKEKQMREIVRHKCSKDGGILYERQINITKQGMRTLVWHKYGKRSWIERKIKHMLATFNDSPKNSVKFLFIYGRNASELTLCKEEIRKLYNDKIFTSSVHIPDTLEENLILSEMILNPNSLQFMNYASNPDQCRNVAKELASRVSNEPISTMPEVYLGRQDIMVDSGGVLSFFNLCKLTDIDLLFLHDIDRRMLGKKHGILVEEHAFRSNAISDNFIRGELHFSGTVKTKWDLFYDPKNYGYCYGIKFVSLKQVITFKQNRNERNKDQREIKLINAFLKSIRQLDS